MSVWLTTYLHYLLIISYTLGEIPLQVQLISCPMKIFHFWRARGLLGVSSLLTNPTSGCGTGQLQPLAIICPTPLISRKPHLLQFNFEKNHLHAHPCFSFSLRKKIKRGEKSFLHNIYVLYSHLFLLNNLFCPVGAETMIRKTLHARNMSYYTFFFFLNEVCGVMHCTHF